MRQTLSQQIRACLARVAEAERLAAAEPDEAAKAELMAMAVKWRQMANGYKYVEKLESFLKLIRLLSNRRASIEPRLSPWRQSCRRSNLYLVRQFRRAIVTSIRPY